VGGGSCPLWGCRDLLNCVFLGALRVSPPWRFAVFGPSELSDSILKGAEDLGAWLMICLELLICVLKGRNL